MVLSSLHSPLHMQGSNSKRTCPPKKAHHRPEVEHHRKAALRMQGFVSNRDSEKNEDKADPLEIVLYAVFVATSARASVGELADILQVCRRATFTFPSKPAI